MSKLSKQDELVLNVEPVLYRTNGQKGNLAFNENFPSVKKQQLVTSLGNFDEKDSYSTTANTKATLLDSPLDRSKNTLNSLTAVEGKAKFITMTQGYAHFVKSTLEVENEDDSQLDHTFQRHNTSLEGDDETDHREDSINSTKRMNRAKSATGLRSGSQSNLASRSFCGNSKSKTGVRSGNKTDLLGRSMQVDQTQRSYSSSRLAPTNDSRSSTSPNRSMRLRNEQRDSYRADDSRLTENMKKVVEERKSMVDHFRKQGVQKYENKVLRQEMERQMKVLENRVRRLKGEEENIHKNIKRTEDVVKKVMNTKQRHLEDTMKLEDFKRRRMQEEKNAREKIQQEKVKRATGIKTSMLSMHIKKSVAANQVKNDFHDQVEIQTKTWRKEEEKRLKSIKSTVDLEKGLKTKKVVGQHKAKEQMDENHVKFLHKEHLKTLEIETKMRELARKEEILIEKIKSTHQIQLKAEAAMKKVLSTKIDKVKPTDL